MSSARNRLINLYPLTKEVKKHYSAFVKSKENAGFDLFFPNDIVVEPRTTKLRIPLGFHVLSNIDLKLVMRSSGVLYTPIRIVNTYSTIHKGYIDEVNIVINNKSDYQYTIEAGKSLMQLCIDGYSPEFDVKIVTKKTFKDLQKTNNYESKDTMDCDFDHTVKIYHKTEEIKDYYDKDEMIDEVTKFDSYDIICPYDISVAPRSGGKRIPLGIFLKPDTTILLKSNKDNFPLKVAANPSIIDKGYEGELNAIVDNWSDEVYNIKAGQKLLKLYVENFSSNFKIEFINKETFNELCCSQRGISGFGSTGTRYF